jgi:chemotaxis protein MotB
MKKALFSLALLSAGCVSSGTYDAAVAELDACKAEGVKQKAAYTEIEKAKAELQAHLDQIQSELKDATAQLESLGAEKQKLEADVAELRKQEEAERASAAIFQDLVAKLKGMIDAGQLSVYIRNGRMLVKLPDNVLFDPGRTDIKAAGKDAIAQLTTALQAIAGRKFQVAGHTDDTPIHTAKFPSNWELSTARAVVVVNFMIKSGMEPQRLSAAGFADTDPVASNDTPEGKAQNRRIEIELLPNLEELPKLEDPSKPEEPPKS